ncbi:MAG: hypothetical protein MR290_02290, partial [Ruminococcus sp.]|nr:hypothetical protein [Ruminococcus sp.]
RVTVIIRTRQKCSIKAIFVAFAVALRQQGCHLKTTNLIFTPSIFDALQFIECRFGLNRGKNAVNPFGLTSILTKSKGKSAAINRGSDYFRYPNQATRREVAFRRVFLCNYTGFFLHFDQKHRGENPRFLPFQQTFSLLRRNARKD